VSRRSTTKPRARSAAGEGRAHPGHIGLTVLVGTQQIEDKVDRKRLDELLSEYQRWLKDRRPAEG
jgi:hypothetical protein